MKCYFFISKEKVNKELIKKFLKAYIVKKYDVNIDNLITYPFKIELFSIKTKIMRSYEIFTQTEDVNIGFLIIDGFFEIKKNDEYLRINYDDLPIEDLLKQLFTIIQEVKLNEALVSLLNLSLIHI